jgi:hypothetical protein
MTSVLKKSYPSPHFCEKEILRYAGCPSADDGTLALMRSCIEEAEKVLTYDVCYRILPVETDGDVCDFGCFSLHSKNLAGNLKHSSRVILFAATVGVGLDRLINKYGKLSPSRALMFQAIGAERIEALCDSFCKDISTESGSSLAPRFSPGYGDLPLSAQKDIFSVLDASRQIGVYLTDSLLMSPSKSVTAFAGFTEKGEDINKCSLCNKKDCNFRRAK